MDENTLEGNTHLKFIGRFAPISSLQTPKIQELS